MGSWTFSRKLTLGFLAMVLLTIAIAVVAALALEDAVASKNRVIEVNSANLIATERLRASLHREVSAARGYLLTGKATQLRALREAREDFEAAAREVQGRPISAEERRLLGEVLESKREHQVAMDGSLESRNQGALPAELLARYESQVMPRFPIVERGVRALEAKGESQLQTSMETAAQEVQRSLAVVVGLGVLSVLAAMLIALTLSRSLVSRVGSSVQHVRSSSAELQAVATQQATGAQEQASAMNEISTTIGELLATSRQITDSSQRVVRIARETAEAAERGDGIVGSAQDSVKTIERQMNVIVSHMLDLGRKSQQVGVILDIINELAEQTNILAINATIEAAGAGESGRRFAVVGEEIRKLADRVGGSTKDVRRLIEEIRSAVNTTVMATETGSKTVTTGTQRFEQVLDSFGRIGELVETSLEAAREIELSTKQQSTAVEQVNIAVSNVAQATKEAEAGSSQTLQTASELASMSDQLARLVQRQPAS